MFSKGRIIANIDRLMRLELSYTHTHTHVSSYTKGVAIVPTREITVATPVDVSLSLPFCRFIDTKEVEECSILERENEGHL